MSSDATHDVVIVGGGIAGMIVANRAAQLGLRATVLEQGDERYPCNTRYTGGTLHVCSRDIMLDEETQRRLIVDSSAGFVHDDLARVIASHGPRVVRWLQEEGLHFMRASGSEHHKWTLAPPRSTGRYKALPIATPPFYAVPAVSGITYTMGAINT